MKDSVTTFPDSSDILKILGDGNDDLYELYKCLCKGTTYCAPAELDDVKRLVLKLNERFKNLSDELWDYKEGVRQP